MNVSPKNVTTHSYNNNNDITTTDKTANNGHGIQYINGVSIENTFIQI